MVLVNTSGIPPQIIRAMMAKDEKYHAEKKDYMQQHDVDYEFSVTTLAQPPRKVQLVKRHWDEIEVDAMDRYYILMGSCIHSILEGHPEPGDLIEHRYGKNVNLVLNGKKIRVHIHGCADVISFSRGLIEDWKFASMMAMNFPKDDYIAQLNALRFLLKKEQKEQITKLYNNFLFRDWRSSDAKAGRSPQPLFCKVVEQPLWDDEKTAAYLKERIIAHVSAIPLTDENLPQCKKEELWFSRDGFRLRRKTKAGDWGKRSDGWAETEEEAHALAKEKKLNEYRLEPTKGSPRRCGFCEARAFCEQAKLMFAESDMEHDENLNL